VLNKHLKRLDVKQKDIQMQFNKLCKLIAIEEPTISERIRQLQINVEALTAAKNYRIKSKV
jgi:DNA-binding Lrp family transcriptional regulator